jgi:hypothetical protein
MRFTGVSDEHESKMNRSCDRPPPNQAQVDLAQPSSHVRPSAEFDNSRLNKLRALVVSHRYEQVEVGWALKNLLLVICGLIVVRTSLEARPTPSSENAATTVVIHYGPNDSHSHSWVRENQKGVLGMSYFQHASGSYTDGHLLYRTIAPDGFNHIDTVTPGVALEKSVLLYDSLARPHIFVAISDDFDQVVAHYYQSDSGLWQSETIIHFFSEGGKFIYEMSADIGPDYSFHLLLLKSRSNVDSDDFWDAWLDSHLYYVTNASGSWQRELIRGYDMQYTYDFYCKSSCRQDIKVDQFGYVHVIYSQQINGIDDPSRLWYATNKSGTWQHEIALEYDYGSRDDAGWFPSLCLDNNDVPYIACDYIDRVYTHSAYLWKLLLIKRLGYYEWSSEVVTSQGDGYYGTDGRHFTGGLAHLVFDSDNAPHIVFSDIASRHESDGQQRVNVGNIRYAVREGAEWSIRTIYRQPTPDVFFDATEMFGLCLNLSRRTDTTRVIGIEIAITAPFQYTCRLVDLALPKRCCAGTTGNVNGSGITDLADLSALVSYLTGGGCVLPCNAAANIDGTGIVDSADLAALVSYLTSGGCVLPSCP